MLMYSEYLVKQSLDLQKILCISYFEPDFKCEKSKLSIITEVHNMIKKCYKKTNTARDKKQIHK